MQEEARCLEAEIELLLERAREVDEAEDERWVQASGDGAGRCGLLQ